MALIKYSKYIITQPCECYARAKTDTLNRGWSFSVSTQEKKALSFSKTSAF